MASEPPSSLERLLIRDRWVIGVCLGVLVALAWLYLLVLARDMAPMPDMPDMPSMPGMSVAEPLGVAPSLHTFGLTIVMWWVMMIGMMVPSATPMVLLFGGVQRRQLADEAPALRVAVFVLGYLVVWGVFSFAAAGAQTALTARALLAPMQLSLSASLGATLVALAGIYQLTPLKNACLSHCRSPADFLSRHWRRGTAGAFRMGLEHGAYCVGCCWLLMALLFVVGVMNLLWVAAIAAFVLIEKLIPRGVLVARASGVALLAFAAYLALGA